MKRRVSISTILSLMLAVAVAEPAAATRLGELASVKGKVWLQRPDWSSFQVVDVGTLLYLGDLLRPEKGSQVTVVCTNGKNWQVPPGVTSGVASGCPPP